MYILFCLHLPVNLHQFLYVEPDLCYACVCRDIIQSLVRDLKKCRIDTFNHHLLLWKKSKDDDHAEMLRRTTPHLLNGQNTASQTAALSYPLHDQPVYIPIFKAVFGLLWKTGVWSNDMLFAGKIADCNAIPAHCGLAVGFPRLFNRGHITSYVVDIPPTIPHSEAVPSKHQFTVSCSSFTMLSSCLNQVCQNCSMCLHGKNRGIFLHGSMMWWFCSAECIADRTLEGGEICLSICC